MIELRSLSCGYGKNIVIDDMCLSFPANAITAIIGPNGCGKSTLLKCIARQLPMQSGCITLGGVDQTQFSRRDFAQKVTYLSQSRQTAPMSVQELVLLGRYPHKSSLEPFSEEDMRIAREAMRDAGVLEMRMRPVGELSGGECQRAYIAMALAQGTDILLLDEPTASLDITHQLEVLELLCSLRQSGKTIVLVLHELNHALHYADNIVVMKKGNIAFSGAPDALLQTDCIDTVFSIRSSILY